VKWEKGKAKRTEGMKKGEKEKRKKKKVMKNEE
jgi:hypothetical protein